MLTLLLFRHAKAERGTATLTDAQRPLAARGRDAADEMGRRLVVAGLMPDLVLCSPATRTLETLALAAPYWTPAPQVSVVPALYERMEGDYLDLVQGAPDVARLMLVAHNAAIEQTARMLATTGDAAALAVLSRGFPTAAIAVIGFEAADWSAAVAGQGYLQAFLTPD